MWLSSSPSLGLSIHYHTMFFFNTGAGDWAKDFMLVWQVLHQLRYLPRIYIQDLERSHGTVRYLLILKGQIVQFIWIFSSVQKAYSKASITAEPTPWWPSRVPHSLPQTVWASDMPTCYSGHYLSPLHLTPFMIPWFINDPMLRLQKQHILKGDTFF